MLGAFSSGSWWVTIWLGRACRYNQITQVRGVPAVVCAPEPDGDALVEQRRPGHLQRPVGVTALRAGAASVVVNTPAMPSRPVGLTSRARSSITWRGFSRARMAPVAGLEADGVDTRHHPAHLLLPRQARLGRSRRSARICPAGSPWRASTGTTPAPGNGYFSFRKSKLRNNVSAARIALSQPGRAEAAFDKGRRGG